MGFEELWVAPTWDCTRNLRQITHYSRWLLPAIESQRKLEVGRISRLALYICSTISPVLFPSGFSYILPPPHDFSPFKWNMFCISFRHQQEIKVLYGRFTPNWGITLLMQCWWLSRPWTSCTLKSILFIISRRKNLKNTSVMFCDVPGEWPDPSAALTE